MQATAFQEHPYWPVMGYEDDMEPTRLGALF
jgi:hypothetical protein